MTNVQFSEVMRTIIIMSLSSGVLALMLFVLKPIIRHCLPTSVQYCLWLVALGALLVPISKLIVVSKTPSNIMVAPIHTLVERDIIIAEKEKNTIPPTNTQTEESPTMPTVKSTQNPASMATTIFMILYPCVVLIVLLYNIFSYVLFTRKVRCHRIRAVKDELYEYIGLCKDVNPPRLYRSPYVTTPMLIGIFNPEIILPDREYSDEQLQSILQHELTHLRRKDVAVKWLSLLACALHWFNPIVWLMRREIERVCELACDEAVISNLDNGGKQNYGDTLISIVTDTKVSRAVLSTTMCEEKKELKNRLSAIMKYKKHTWITWVFSMVIIVMAICGSCVLGAGASTPSVDEPSVTGITEQKASELSRYYADDIETINNIIDNNGLQGYEKDKPETWNFAMWAHVPNYNNRITWINLGGKSLTGTLDVSKLTELESLKCQENALTAINVSKNEKLMQIDCGDNLITSLDVRNNINLEWLGCYRNKLKELDITQNVNLISLTCPGNSLRALDVSKNKELIYLECSMNKIAVLDLSQNLELETIHAYENELTTLDLTGLNDLKMLQYVRNPLKTFILPDGSEGSTEPSGHLYFKD